ncbi:MAG TPA: GAF domain-containing protein, partial [Gammaproteobacteria bacterium]|nr:GAF domain-containing protein [Gammaproteobacteria bacterium]
MDAWEQFLVDGRCPSKAIRDTVRQSWERCSQLGVAPDRNRAPMLYTEDSLRQLVSNLPELAEAARAVCVRARDFLAESGTIMVITDPEGVIIHAEGNPNTIEAAGDISLIPGGQWQEGVAGTNAIGTALEAQGPVQIHGAEHFCEGIKKWTCSATVVEDPFDRRILGVVDISGPQSTYDPHCLALAVSTAAAIQEQILKQAMEKRASLLDKVIGRFTSRPSEGLILFDDRGRLVNANADAATALERQGVLPRESHAEIARFSDNRLYDRAGQELSMVSPDWVTPVVEGACQLGTVLVVPDGERSSSRQRRAGVGRGRPPYQFEWIRELCPSLGGTLDKAQRLARHNVSVLIRGETGVGKEVMAR